MADELNLEKTGLGLNITPKKESEEKEPTYEELQAEVEALEEEVVFEAEVLTDPEDLNKKDYVKITPTLYIQAVIPEEDEEIPEGVELFKILNPETGVAERRPLTDGEKREIYIHELKGSRIKFRNTIHSGNVTKTKFGPKYKQKRRRKNTLTKKSRRANR